MSQPKLRAADNKVEAITALTNAANIRKLLRVPGEDGTTNFEVVSVRPITLQGNGHNTEVIIRVDLAYGQSGLPIPESDRYSTRRETCHRIDLRDVAKVAALTVNDKGQFEGTVTDIASLNTLLGTALTEDDVTINPVADVLWVRTKPTSLGYIGQLTIASGGEAPEVLPTSVKVTLSAEEVTVGQKVTANVEVLPANAANKSFTATTSDPLIATINEDGTEITGVKVGTVKITYTATAAPTVKLEKTVNVKAVPVVKPTGIQVTNVPAEMTVGDEVTNVAIAVTPANATDKTFTATTSDEYVVNVSADGKIVTAIGFGTGTLTYTANGDPTVKQTISVSVVEPPAPLPDRFQVDGAPASVNVDQTSEFYVQLFPLNAAQEWDVVSSEPTVIEASQVENRCVVKGLSVGVSKITITARNKPELVWTQDITVTVAA